MASVDKVKVGSTSYDISPSKDGTLKGYTSNDAASPTAWTAVNAITTSDNNSTIFSKITTMVKNVRWLYSKLGTTDFSATGQSTVTGALSALQTGLNGKAASSHSHTTAQLPVSSSQTNSNSYIPTSALVYSMQQQITSLNVCPIKHDQEDMEKLSPTYDRSVYNFLSNFGKDIHDRIADTLKRSV